MNLQDVRAAADILELIDRDSLAPSLTISAYNHLRKARDYILSTIPTDPEGEITPEWLREEWGFQEAEWSSRGVLENGHSEMTPRSLKAWEYVDDNFVWPRHITTRYQFTQLMQSLGIQPRGKGGEMSRQSPSPAMQPENSPGK